MNVGCLLIAIPLLISHSLVKSTGVENNSVQEKFLTRLLFRNHKIV